MDGQERERLQQVVEAAHHTAAALVRAARASWPTGPGWGPVPAPGNGTLTSFGANDTEARMYTFGATSWPGSIAGGYGFGPMGLTPFAGPVPFTGPGYGAGVGLTHAGPGTFGSPFGPGLVPASPWGVPGINYGYGYRPYGLAHAGPESFGPGLGNPLAAGFGPGPNPGFPGFGFGAPGLHPGLGNPGYVGLPLAPAWTGNGIG